MRCGGVVVEVETDYRCMALLRTKALSEDVALRATLLLRYEGSTCSVFEDFAYTFVRLGTAL
jgi:hypothetical protein